MRILVDADAYIALYSKSDALNNKAQQVLKRISNKRAKIFTTYDVVDEVTTKLSYHVSKKASLKFLDELNITETEIIFPTESSFTNTIKKIASIKSERVSFTDCANMAACKEYDMDAIFSFDKVYEKQGLKTLKP